MKSQENYCFPEGTENIINFKALRLSRTSCFTLSDRDDIEQELRLHLLQQTPRFNPAITSWRKYVSFILDKKCTDLRRRRTAAKRCPNREESSLNDDVLDDDGQCVQRSETTPEASRDAVHDLDRATDVASYLESLPNIQRQICQLRGEHSKSSIARELGISRPEVNRHLDAILRAAEDVGLEVYL